MIILSYIHSLFVWGCSILFSIVTAVIIILLSLVKINNTHIVPLIKLWGRSICMLSFVTVKIIGTENLEKDKVYIFASNHQGYYDIFSYTGYLPVDFIMMAKHTLFKIPLIGKGMALAGYIPVDRYNKRKSYESFISAIEGIKKGKSLIIFPESTRSIDGTIGEFKKGGLIAGLRSGVPIVPVTIKGSHNIMKKGSILIRPGEIKIFIDKPLEINNLNKANTVNILTGLRNKIIANYEKI